MRRVCLMTVLAFLVAVAVGCAALNSSAKHSSTIPGADSFTRHGWIITGEAKESRDKLPSDFNLRSGQFPWAVYLDLSRDIGLDFASHAGKDVRVLRFSVKDKQEGERLKEIAARYDLQGVVLLDNNRVIGAWLIYVEKDGTVLVGIPAYSLNAKDLEQVTGMKWPEYAAKRSPPGNVEYPAWGFISEQQAVNAVFGSNLLVGISDLEKFPRSPGENTTTIAMGGPVTAQLPATFETAVTRVDAGYRVTLTMRWKIGGTAEPPFVATYNVSEDGNRVVEVSRKGDTPQTRR